MAKRKQKPSLKPDRNNNAGPVDKTPETEHIPGISDDTLVIYSEEKGRQDG